MENNKYLNGKIYKITNNLNNDIYIGSTCQNLKQRFQCHIRRYKQFINNKTNKLTVFDLFIKYGVNNCKIELIELYNCNSKNELELKEGYYIKNNNCVNKYIAGRSKQQYRIDNKEKIKNNKKIYYIKNKDIIKEKIKIKKLKLNNFNDDNR